jgi:C4-dicarboxylate-specific signal transduction histidine kinase
MSERGGGHPDPNRLAKLAKSLKKQVALGDDLLRHMNRFAHSVDAPTGDTDIAALLECVAALVRRTADRRQVSLDLQVPATPPMAHTSAFLLMQLMWFFLDAAMGQGLPARALSLCCEKAPEGVVISIAGALADDDLDKAISAATDLLGSLGATVTRVPEPPALRLVLPA